MDSLKNPRLKEFSRDLRKNMAKEERHLWYDFLKRLPVMVHRQRILGSYIVDFYIAEKKLAIELDGSQHYGASGKEADVRRDANSEVHQNFKGVCSDILAHLTNI